MLAFPTKRIAEAYYLDFDFIGRLPLGETIDSATAVGSVISGVDASPDILGDPLVVSGTIVQVPVQNGVQGVTYKIVVNAVFGSENVDLEGCLAVL